MYFLNDLDDYKLYKNRKILGIDKNTKDYKKGNCILYLGNDLKSLLENNILYTPYYKAYFVPFKFTTYKLKKVKKLDQKVIYNNIKGIGNLNVFKKSITMYKGFNLIYDLNYEINECLNEYSVKGQTFIKNFINMLSSKTNVSGYKDSIIAIEVPSDTNLASINLTNANSIFELLYMSIKKKLASQLTGINFLFYTKNGCYIKFKYDPNVKLSLINKAFLKIVNAANNSSDVTEDEAPPKEAYISNDKITRDIKLTNVKELICKKLNIDTKSLTSSLSDQIEVIDNLLVKKMNNMNLAYENLDDEDLLEILETEPELLKEIELAQSISVNAISDEKEIRRLRKKQEEVTFEGRKLADILNEANDLKIDKVEIDNKEVINEEVKHNTVLDFDNSYAEKQLKKDIINTITAFNDDEDIKLFVKNIRSENTSDAFTKKMTYHIEFEDELKRRHTVNINYPILKDNKFLLINGGKKLLLKQLMLLPIVKTKPDTVQISTNYNKLFITRFGSKLNDGTENIKKLLFTPDIKNFIKEGSGFNFKVGNVSIFNKGFAASLEFGELSKNIISIENDIYKINFNLSELKSILKDPISQLYIKSLAELEYDDVNYFPVGYLKSKKAILLCQLDNNNIFIYDGSNYTKVANNLILFIIDELLKKGLTDDKIKEFYSYGQAKTLTYTRMRITGKTVPLIIVLGYERGLTNIMDRYGIKYQFITDGIPNKKFGQKRIKFNNGYLLYDSLDLKTTLLLDGMTTIDTSVYDFEEMDTKVPYIEWFYDNCGSRNTGKGIHNMLSLMIDPITKEILESLKLPTKIEDVILYANTLLADASYKTANDMSCYRVRGAEQINAVLFKVLADAFKTYKDTSNNGNPIKISLDPDILIKTMMSHKTVDEYSILNPSLEIDKISACTFKGPSGINLDRRFNRKICDPFKHILYMKI